MKEQQARLSGKQFEGRFLTLRHIKNNGRTEQGDREAVYRIISLSGWAIRLLSTEFAPCHSLAPLSLSFFPTLPPVDCFLEGRSLSCLYPVALNARNFSLWEPGCALSARCRLRACRAHTLTRPWRKALHILEDSY